MTARHGVPPSHVNDPRRRTSYTARLVNLDGVMKVKVETSPERYLVGYFPIGGEITYHGQPVELADITIEEGGTSAGDDHAANG